MGVLDQLKAWEAFRELDVGRRENPPMHSEDVTPAHCLQGGFTEGTPSCSHGCLVITAKAVEATCKAKTAPSGMETADPNSGSSSSSSCPK